MKNTKLDHLKSFIGKRHNPEDKKRLMERVRQLYLEKVPLKTMRDLLHYEGFRRVDGSDLTKIAFIKAQRGI